MKKIIFLILITLGIYACSKKDDPKPQSTECARVHSDFINHNYTGTDSLNLSIQYNSGLPSTLHYKDTHNYDGSSFNFNNKCYPNGATIKYTLWNDDSTYFKTATGFCTPNDTILIELFN